jgi:hypothetical protein
MMKSDAAINRHLTDCQRQLRMLRRANAQQKSEAQTLHLETLLLYQILPWEGQHFHVLAATSQLLNLGHLNNNSWH